MNESMYALQRELFEDLKKYDTVGHEWYLPNRWVPHCALALMKDDADDAFFQASNLILRNFRKLSGKFVSVGLIKITFPVEEIYTVDLNG